MLKALCLLFCLSLAACSNVEVSRYSQEKPALELRQFFTGRVEA